MKMIRRHLHYCIAIVMSAYGGIALAQEPLSVSEVSRLADEALKAVLPPDAELSRVSVAHRTIHFDYETTLRAFGHSPTMPSRLDMSVPARLVDKSVLADCGGFEAYSCKRLGWGIYAAVEPLSLSDKEAKVVVHVIWGDRGQTPFDRAVTPTGRAIRVGFSTELFFVKTPGNGWELAKEGVTIAY